ncbi:MAG TPA: glycerate kinase [Syntrophorhabdaceae bacterium]|jgi:hydroxypyruvate reductase/glycerate 2-kinase
MNPQSLLRQIFESALQAVDPYETVKVHGDVILSQMRRGKYGRLKIVSFGKAAYLMAKALQDQASDLIGSGIVITKYGHAQTERLGAVMVREAGHPLPDLKGYEATKEAVHIVGEGDSPALIACLISGGGSALLVAPYGEITLAEKQKATSLLLRGGADITEVNTVRKHISLVKGGRLAGLASPSRVISLILSDVIGDRLDVIASGPTAPDNTTYSDALAVIAKYGLGSEMPPGVLDVLKRGAGHALPETPKGGDPIFAKVENIIIGNNKMAAAAAKRKAESLGLATTVISTEVRGEAKLLGRTLAERAKKSLEAMRQTRCRARKGICLISGGEPTVTVTGNGQGGRNTELALAFAREIEGVKGITFLSAATDGTDGPTDAAGAMVDGNTTSIARRTGTDPLEHLNNNDSYNFFRKAGGLFMTGPTGTNVMDLHMAIIESPVDKG